MGSIKFGGTTRSIQAGGVRWRQTAQRIYEYLRRQMGDAETQRRNLYPKTWDTQQQRTIPLIWRMARELATLYLRAPARSFKGVDEATLETIQEVYRRARVNRKLRTAQEHLSVLGNATVWVWLTSDGFRLLTPPVHDQWAFSGRIDGEEVDDIVEWRIRFSVITDAAATEVSTAIALITPQKAVWESGPKGWAGVGIWAKDGSNPFGRIPCVMLRSSDPAPGEFFAPVPEDLLDAQRAVNHDYTSAGDWGRKQGFAQAVAKGLTQQQANEIEVGPESVVGIPADGDFDFKNPKPDLAGFTSQLDSFVKLVIACSGLSPATVMKSTGITALAKIVENIDREVERQRAKDEFELGEQQLYDLMQLAQEIRSGGLAVMPRGVRVSVQHREPVTPADPVSDAQAKKQRREMFLDCAASILAAELAIPIAEAQALAKRNKDLDAELSVAPTAPDTTPADTTPLPADAA